MGADKAFTLGITGAGKLVRCTCGCNGCGIRETIGEEITVFGIVRVTSLTKIEPEAEAAFLAGASLARSAAEWPKEDEAQDHA